MLIPVLLKARMRQRIQEREQATHSVMLEQEAHHMLQVQLDLQQLVPIM